MIQNAKKHKHILVIEDEDLFRDILEKELVQAGYRVTLARDGEEGLASVKKEKPDLVLLDIVMPKKDGFQVLSEMKADKKLAGIPVVVLSNSGDVVELDWARKLGAYEVLIKADFGPHDLLDRLRGLFQDIEAGEGNGASGAVSAAAAAEERQSRAGSNVLVVEDEPDLQNLLKVKLAREKYHVSIAGTGGEAISKARAQKPDLILLDLILPDMKGFDILEQLRGYPETKDIPVIVLSNLGQQGDVSKAIEMGAKDYLIKAHHTPEQIVQKIQENTKQ